MKDKVKIPYKQLQDDDNPVTNGSHPACELPHQHQVQYEEAARRNYNQKIVFLIIALLTLIVAVISLSAQAILFKEFYDLKNEVDLQMEMLDKLSRNRGSNTATTESSAATYSDEVEETEALELGVSYVPYRVKRSDEPPRNRNSKRRSQSRSGQRQDRGRDQSSQSEISAVHMVINSRHADFPPGALKTGVRGAVIKYWKFSDELFSSQQTFAVLDTNTGDVKIEKNGLYYIYSQMTYFDRSGRWSHQINIDQQPFIKCLASEWGIEQDPETGALYNTIHQCHTAAVTYIQRGQKVTIRSMYPDRVIHEDKDMTFIGLVKLS